MCLRPCSVAIEFSILRATSVSSCAGAAPGSAAVTIDRRQVDVRKVLHLHRVEGQQAGEGQQHEQHHRRDRVADRPGGDVHRHRELLAPPLSGRSRRGGRGGRGGAGRPRARPRAPGRRRSGSRRRWRRRASGARPASDLDPVADAAAVATLRAATRLSLVDDEDVAEAVAQHDRRCGTVSAVARPSSNSPRANMPGAHAGSAARGRST